MVSTSAMMKEKTGTGSAKQVLMFAVKQRKVLQYFLLEVEEGLENWLIDKLIVIVMF